MTNPPFLHSRPWAMETIAPQHSHWVWRLGGVLQYRRCNTSLNSMSESQVPLTYRNLVESVATSLFFGFSEWCVWLLLVLDLWCAWALVHAGYLWTLGLLFLLLPWCGYASLLSRRFVWFFSAQMRWLQHLTSLVIQNISLEGVQALVGNRRRLSLLQKVLRETLPALPTFVDQSMIQWLVLCVVEPAISVVLSPGEQNKHSVGRHVLHLQAF